jgi:hypothetical protein
VSSVAPHGQDARATSKCNMAKARRLCGTRIYGAGLWRWVGVVFTGMHGQNARGTLRMDRLLVIRREENCCVQT